jgi:hypothetical protein
MRPRRSTERGALSLVPRVRVYSQALSTSPCRLTEFALPRERSGDRVLKNHPGAAAQKYDSSFGQGELA